MSRPKLVLLITEDWYFWSHRLPIACAARDAGFEVIVATRVHEHRQRIEREGLRVVPIALRRDGRNPFRELASILDLVRLYREERPVLVHHVAAKPILYGSVAARLAGVPAIVNAVAGLGHVFVSRGAWARVIQTIFRGAYRIAFSSRHSCVLFQTEANRSVFVDNGVVSRDRTVVVGGSGVDTSVFVPGLEPPGPPIVMLAGRLIWNKGIADLFEAGAMLRHSGRAARIVLVGVPDAANPMAVPEAHLRAWESSGDIEWWRRRDDMPAVIQQASIVVLPTDGEGVPKILLEAASAGKPIVASDVPGCRDVVRNGENGLLVPAANPPALADAIGRLLDAPAVRRSMGDRGREIAVKEFSDRLVADRTLAVYRSLLERSGLMREAAALS